MNQNDFIKGALLGGVLGGVAALLLAPKSGKELRDDLNDNYQAINKRSHEFSDNIKDKGQDLIDMFNGVEHNNSHSTLFFGGAIGAVIGAVAALLLTPQAGSKLREQLGDKYEGICEKAQDAVKQFNKTRDHLEHNVEDWKDTFLTLIDRLSSEKNGKHNSKAINNIVDWAHLGLQLYTQLQKRR